MRITSGCSCRSEPGSHKEELVPNRAKGYEPGEDGLLPAPYLNHLWPYAAGSLCSTVRDLMAWNQALHGDGEGGDILSPESYQLMITPETLHDGTELRYAKGLAITDRDAAPYAGRYEGPARGRRMVAEVGIQDGQPTIEIGPGWAGALTWLGATPSGAAAPGSVSCATPTGRWTN